jgi:hypothetical protein
VHAAWLANGEGRVIEYIRTLKVRERTVWLTDHPGTTVEDFDRERRPLSCADRASITASMLLPVTQSPKSRLHSLHCCSATEGRDHG